MFGMGWGELMIVGLVALIVVGPKELPVMFRTLGRFAGKAKGMAREFSSAMNDAADSTGMKDVAKDLNNIANPRSMGMDKLEEAVSKFEDWEPGKEKKHHSSQKAMGSNTAKLAQERAEAARKIHEKTAQSAAERKTREAREALDAAEAKPATKPKAKAKPKPKAAAKPKTTAKKSTS
jgi:sec-independent protein translocase protein TatB